MSKSLKERITAQFITKREIETTAKETTRIIGRRIILAMTILTLILFWVFSIV
jgi:hypothetical protein